MTLSLTDESIIEKYEYAFRNDIIDAELKFSYKKLSPDGLTKLKKIVKLFISGSEDKNIPLFNRCESLLDSIEREKTPVK
jgi:predicted nucleic acid-binding OB-fold protein